MQQPIFTAQTMKTHQVGIKLFLDGNHPQALEYFTLAAKDKYPPAYVYLNFMHQNGIGTDINEEESKRFLSLWQIQKNREWLNHNQPGESHSHLADIYDNFGYLYMAGTESVAVNHRKALEFLSIAASYGLPNAQNNLGYLYQYGLGIKKNHKTAFKHYESAMKQNCATAWENMGIAFLEDASFNDLSAKLKKEFKPCIKSEASANLYCAIYCFKQAKKLAETTEDKDHLHDIDNNLKRAQNELEQFTQAEATKKSESKKRKNPNPDKTQNPPPKKPCLPQGKNGPTTRSQSKVNAQTLFGNPQKQQPLNAIVVDPNAVPPRRARPR